jgi:hypothetical protein
MSDAFNRLRLAIWIARKNAPVTKLKLRGSGIAFGENSTESSSTPKKDS